MYFQKEYKVLSSSIEDLLEKQGIGNNTCKCILSWKLRAEKTVWVHVENIVLIQK